MKLNWKLLPFSRAIPVALVGVLFSFFYLENQSIGEPERRPTRMPGISPYREAVPGAGIVEPVNESIAVAPYFSGKVTDVYVKVGQFVEKGDALFKMNTDTLQAQKSRLSAELDAANARVQASQARRKRLGAEPRSVTLPALKARVASMQASLLKAKDSLNRLKAVVDTRAVSEQEITQQQLTVAEYQAQLDQARAELAEKQAGAWEPDLEEANASINEGKANANSVRAQIKELDVQLSEAIVRAPISGKVLQVNTRVGESLQLAMMGGAGDPAVLIGDTSVLQVRVDIDEVLASQVRSGMEAQAIVKGNRRLRFPLIFDHIEPFMVPKTSLTGSTAERKDVRVLQIVYTFEPPEAFEVYPGQQVEVYLNAEQTAVDKQFIEAEPKVPDDPEIEKLRRAVQPHGGKQSDSIPPKGNTPDA